MRFTVPAIIMCMIGALLSIVLSVQPVLAACTNNSQCPSDMTCQNTWVPWIKECKQLPCNFSFQPGVARSDMCPSDRPDCSGGACRAAASSGSGGGAGTPSGTGTPSGAGISQGDVGGRCGQIKLGQVTKSVGCKPGLQCVKVPPSSSSGTCQRLAQ